MLLLRWLNTNWCEAEKQDVDAYLATIKPLTYTGFMNSVEPEQLSMHRGFAAPIDDQRSLGLDLHQHLIKHPAATFFMRATGTAAAENGILPGDLLVVDRSEKPQPNSIVVVALNSVLCVKRFAALKGKDFELWGVVTYAIHDLRTS